MTSTDIGTRARQTLTDEEIASYEREGFVIPDMTLPQADFAELKGTIGQIMAAATGNINIIRQPHIPVRNGLDMDKGNPWGAEIFRHALNPVLLDCVEQILGPDIIMFTALIFAKPAAVGREVPWHQDGFYSPPRPLSDSLTAWIGIDPCAPDNGCLRFIPGSNKFGLVPHFEETRANLMTNHNIDRTYFDPDTAVDSILLPGQFSLHGEYTIHGSNANTSGKRRVGFAPRYMSASAYYDRNIELHGGTSERAASPSNTFPIWVVRGENRNDKNDLTFGHEGLEELDELAAAACRETAARRR